MEHVCPLCNGLNRLNALCSCCGAPLEDDGPVTDYAGPYAPYELSPRVKQTARKCVHFLHCPACGKESYAIIQNDVI